MNTSTGTFTTQDTYQRSIFDPVTLHKYLYANANPVNYSDPSGYNSLAETQVAFVISEIIDSAAAMASQFALTVWSWFTQALPVILVSVLAVLTLPAVCEAVAAGAIALADVVEIAKEEIKKKRKPDIGWIIYDELDELGRATGAVGKITRSLLDTGSSANPYIRPTGFENGTSPKKGGAGHARGHLIAKRLGGDGKDARNLVTLHQNPVNNGIMKHYESLVYTNVKLGQNVYIAVIPFYIGDTGMPHSILMTAIGDRGFSFSINILNSLEGVFFSYD